MRKELIEKVKAWKEFSELSISKQDYHFDPIETDIVKDDVYELAKEVNIEVPQIFEHFRFSYGEMHLADDLECEYEDHISMMVFIRELINKIKL